MAITPIDQQQNTRLTRLEARATALETRLTALTTRVTALEATTPPPVQTQTITVTGQSLALGVAAPILPPPISQTVLIRPLTAEVGIGL